MVHSVDVLKHANRDNLARGHVRATVYDDELQLVRQFGPQTETHLFWITPDDLGPIDSSFVRRLVAMTLSFALTSFGPSGNLCLVWNISMEYDFRNRGQIELSLSSRVSHSCDEHLSFKEVWEHGYWLNFAIIAAATCNIVLSTRSIAKSFAILWRLRNRHFIRSHDSEVLEEVEYEVLHDMDNNTPATSNNMDLNPEPTLTITGAARLFNKWFFIMLLASVCNVVSATIFLVNGMKHAPTTAFHKMCAGFGCALLWISLVTYASGSFHYYTLVHTLSRALPRVLRFVVGVFPVYLGYALFGMLYFGDQSERFADFAESMITLFALLNGDEIRSTFMDLNQPYPLVSAVYLYSFVCLFIYVVLNVFIAIVEESFFASRAKTRSLEQFTAELNRREQGDNSNVALMESMIQELRDPLLGTPGSQMTRGEDSDAVSLATLDSNAGRRGMYDPDDTRIESSVSRALRRRLEVSRALRSLDEQ